MMKDTKYGEEELPYKITHDYGFWTKVENQREYLIWLSRYLGYKKKEDWYTLRQRHFEETGGIRMIRHYSYSIQKILSTFFPEESWPPWCFATVPSGFWSNPKNQRAYMDWLAERSNFDSFGSFYSLQQDKFRTCFGWGFLNHSYSGSVTNAIVSVYPEFPWNLWDFSRCITGYWTNMDNQVAYLSRLGKLLGFASLENWYSITIEKLRKHSGGSLINIYNNSCYLMMKNIYPLYDWEPWKFQVAHKNFWNQSKNIWDYFNKLGLEMNFKTYIDWHKLTVDLFNKAQGATLIHTFSSDSPFKLMFMVYPQFLWAPWDFHRVPRGFWKKEGNQRMAVDTIGRILGVKRMEDWYEVGSTIHFGAMLGTGISEEYKSIPALLQAVYPEYKFFFFKFASSPAGHGMKGEELREFLQYAEAELQLHSLADWYRVSYDQLQELGGKYLILQNGGLFSSLSKTYQACEWESSKLSAKTTKRAGQRSLRMKICSVFDLTQDLVLEEYKHHSLLFPSTGLKMELDVYIPSLSLAVEYQGKQHYHDSTMFGSTQSYFERDEEKKKACREHGLTLIDVPYWWDSSEDSLRVLLSEQQS